MATAHKTTASLALQSDSKRGPGKVFGWCLGLKRRIRAPFARVWSQFSTMSRSTAGLVQQNVTISRGG